MIAVYPFQGITYATGAAGDISDLVTQPYDKIDATLQAAYYEASPYNLVRVEKRQGGDYAGAARTFADWLASGVLVRAPRPSLYLYDQEYAPPGGGKRRTRRAMVALLGLEPLGTGVLPHERTLSAPRADRLALLDAVRAHLGQIFLLYSDPEATALRPVEEAVTGAVPMLVARTRPSIAAAASPAAEVHRLWAIEDPAVHASVATAMRDRRVVIADGHHRYETALAFRAEHHWAGAVMATLVREEDPGLLVLATHRLIPSLGRVSPRTLLDRLVAWFALERTEDVTGATMTLLLREGRAAYSLRPRPGLDLASVVPGPGSPALRRLEVVFLHRCVLGQVLGIDEAAVAAGRGVDYVRAAGEAVHAVFEAGTHEAAFLLTPIAPGEVRRIAEGGERLPQKSTDFYPKMLSGMVMYGLEGP